jgi:hypothetical protein
MTMLFLLAFFGFVPSDPRTVVASAQRADHQPVPNPVSPPRPPLVLPPNCRDVTAEKVGTVIGIVGATAAKAGARASASARDVIMSGVMEQATS